MECNGMIPPVTRVFARAPRRACQSHSTLWDPCTLLWRLWHPSGMRRLRRLTGGVTRLHGFNLRLPLFEPYGFRFLGLPKEDKGDQRQERQEDGQGIAVDVGGEVGRGEAIGLG